MYTTAELRRFTKVYFRFNGPSHKKKERKWVKIRDGSALIDCLTELVQAAIELPGDFRAGEIISRAGECSNSTCEQLEVAWVVAKEVARQKIDVDRLAAIDAWTIKGHPEMMVVNVSVKKDRRKKRAGATS